MSYFDEMNKAYNERYEKSITEIKLIINETKNKSDAYQELFHSAGQFVLKMVDFDNKLSSDFFETSTFDELKAYNKSLYEEVLNEQYELSYANPEKCTELFGKEMGQLLSSLYTVIVNEILYVVEGQRFRLALNNELLINIYNAVKNSADINTIKNIIKNNAMEAVDLKAEDFVVRRYDIDFNCYANILTTADLKDLRYLFRYGLYVSEDEIKTAEYLLSLPEEKIQLMADVFTNSFFRGYEIGNKQMPLEEKESIIMAYPLGFERVIRKAVDNFKARGLKPIVYSHYFTAPRPYLMSTRPSRQFAYDHRFDDALYLTKEYVSAYEKAFSNALEKHKDKVRKSAGIALQECFGEKPFSPKSKTSIISYNDEITEYKNELTTAVNKLVNDYLPSSLDSFVIITYPIPSIGETYQEIFDEVIKVNTLDNDTYDRIHKYIIDALDEGEFAHVLGCDGNKTDITVKLHELKNPEKETNFENCTADVNVPVGEVFTSPVLKGTNGTIHVSEVYLNDLRYDNLEIVLKDGMIESYNCSNFDLDEENKKFVHENLIHPHKTLPLGEFAIGTNTTAYVMSAKYKIANIMPILIAEKMGPHFAIGDTCYSWSEDVKVYNSDGKEIIARENEKTALRNEDLNKAYTYKHTDITIPYEELALIEVIKNDGSTITIIKDGRFVLPGTEQLNEPFGK